MRNKRLNRTQFWSIVALLAMFFSFLKPASIVSAWHGYVGDPSTNCDGTYTIPVNTTWVDGNGKPHVGYIISSSGLTGKLADGVNQATVSYSVKIGWPDSRDTWSESSTRTATRPTNCYQKCSVTAEPEYGTWSEWRDNPDKPGWQIRYRHVIVRDSQDSTVICSEYDQPDEREKPYEQCSVTAEPEYGTWSEWRDNPDKPGWQIRYRHVIVRDSKDANVICDEYDQPDEREKPYEQCTVTATPEIGEWGPWRDNPDKPGWQIRYRHVTIRDSKDATVICNEYDEPDEREKPYEQCSITAEPEYGPWGEWQDNPDKPGWQIRYRHVTVRDAKDATVICNEYDQPDEREKPYEKCSVGSKPEYGPWSEWMQDPNDPKQLYRVRHVIVRDSKDPNVICDEYDDYDFKNKPTPKWEWPSKPYECSSLNCGPRQEERPGDNEVTFAWTTLATCEWTWDYTCKGWSNAMDKARMVDIMGGKNAPFSIYWAGEFIPAKLQNGVYKIYNAPVDGTWSLWYGLIEGKWDDAKWNAGEYKRLRDVLGTKNVREYISCAISYWDGDIDNGVIYWKPGSNTWELAYFLVTMKGYSQPAADKIALEAHDNGHASLK